MAARQHAALVRWGNRLALGLALLAIGSMGFVYARWLWREQRFNQLIAEIAARQGMGNDFQYLVKAVVRRESEFDPFAYGRAGEIGLMQVTPAAGLDWAQATRRAGFHKDQLWDPRTNIEAGAWYLARAVRRWGHADDPLPFALAEYNAGLGNVRKWLPTDQPPAADQFVAAISYLTVRDYIATVTRYYEHYRQQGRL
jgi:soluble lytic murein transglycosylase